MEIYVKRIRQGKNSTLSELYINSERVCYVLENLVREEKVYGRTAIPTGRYKLTFRRGGGMHDRYSRLFPSFHQGMIELMDVPNFSYIYLHIGNHIGNTLGCLLVGKTMEYFEQEDEYKIWQSRTAYIALYKRLATMMEKGEVFIEIRDWKLEAGNV